MLHEDLVKADMCPSKSHKSIDLPQRPKEPEPYECCGRGCDPCIFDYYAAALARWEQRVAELQKEK